MKPAAFLLFLAGSALAQTAKPAFEVASVKIDQQFSQGESVETAPGTLTMRSGGFTTMLAWAYQLRILQISGPG